MASMDPRPRMEHTRHMGRRTHARKPDRKIRAPDQNPTRHPANPRSASTKGESMTIGSDQLDAWGKTLIECDNLYREVQLLIRINPEAYNVDSTALAAVGVANADAYDDGGMDHPIAFARRWAWHLAAENKGIPPITNTWVPLIRYVSAHLQYLSGDDRELFGQELRRLRGLLGALVNENGLAQGEAEDRQKINA